jgi:hypothetical protein
LGDGDFSGGVDLFGLPVRPGKGQRGRPPFEVTPEIRNRVKLLLALGWATQRIANAIDASVATVKRYFRAELAERDAMRDRLEARQIEVAAEAAMTGNPSAMRVFTLLVERNDRMEATRKIAGGGDRDSAPAGASAKPPEKLAAPGKKEQKQTDAAAAIAADPDLFARPATKH